MSRSGADLALLLLGGYRGLVDAVRVELAARGYEDIRPTHEFALRAVRAGADNAAELGRRLAVSKQAAAKTIDALVERGYLARDPDPADARRKRLTVTPAGLEMMHQGELLFDELRTRFAEQIGAAALEALEANLARLVGDAPIRLDAPGWAAGAI
jgi:DNA-binding MarR family transcriptional regulator